jgi:FixJ family two-component response regulator
MPELRKIETYRQTPPSRPAYLGERAGVEPVPVVLVVDDDDDVREAFCDLLESVGAAVVGFGSARELLDSDLLEGPGCLVLDVRMPGMGGLALQEHLIAQRIVKPIIFVTGHGDIEMCAQAMKAGAVDFLAKPLRGQTLLDAVDVALARDEQQRAQTAARRRNMDLFATLTSRERQVMGLVVEGSLNKQIAFELGISEVTVKLHRGSVMRKMTARSVAHLVCAWQSLPADVRARPHVVLA